MEAIAMLVKEHDSILKMIKVTRTILNTDDVKSVEIDHVEQIIDFIVNFADKYHHLKEEDVLFMEMQKHGMSTESGPIAVMLSEHDKGRAYIKQALEGVAKFKSGDNKAYDEIRVNLLNYCELLVNHIAKENNILYPMAQRILPENIVSAMTVQFEKTNSSTVENEYFDKYLKSVDELSAIYLNE